jgi:AcrR family transcriptional regulator
MTDEMRPYRKKVRAELEQATRVRITESAVALHGTLGPSRTSLSAIAEHAGVRRSTLYRHFADEAQLFRACSAHWMAANPLPDIEQWAALASPGERLRAALTELYEYYAQNEVMLGHLIRDAETMPIVAELFGPFDEYMEATRGALMRGRRARGRARARVVAAIGHALAFTTWRSLAREQRLDNAHAVALMCALVGAVYGTTFEISE